MRFGGDAAAQKAQRLQRIFRATQHAHQHCRATQQQHYAEAFAQTFPAVCMLRQRVQRMQVDGGDYHQQRPAEHLQPQGNDRRNQPQGGGEHDDAEEFLDAFHPRSGLRQQRTGKGADQQQRHAHAQGHDEERRAAQCRIAGLRDVEQRAGQRCCNTGADDQRRQGAHQRDGGQRPSLAVGCVGHPALQRCRKLQLVEAEHGKRQHDEDQREAAQHPGILQCSRQQRTRKPGGDTHGGIGDRHAQHIGQRQHE